MIIIDFHLNERKQNVFIEDVFYLVYCMQKIDRQKKTEENNNANTLFVMNKKKRKKSINIEKERDKWDYILQRNSNRINVYFNKSNITINNHLIKLNE